MASGLNVSLTDEMRALIRSDIKKEAERHYVFTELLKSADDIKNDLTYSAAEVGRHMEAFLGD